MLPSLMRANASTCWLSAKRIRVSTCALPINGVNLKRHTVGYGLASATTRISSQKIDTSAGKYTATFKGTEVTLSANSSNVKLIHTTPVSRPAKNSVINACAAACSVYSSAQAGIHADHPQLPTNVAAATPNKRRRRQQIKALSIDSSSFTCSNHYL